MKLLLWILIGLVVLAWLARGKKSPNATGASGSAAKGRQDDGEAMYQCAYCKVHIPASESVVAPSGAVFCSEDHRRLGDLRS